ncbi:MAG: hypothetical protein WCO65_01480 [bacterium]
MEKFNSQRNLEAGNKSIDAHNSFFSKENVTKFFGNTLFGAGTIYLSAGIYEFLSGHKISHLTESFKDHIPNAINTAIEIAGIVPFFLVSAGSMGLMYSGQKIEKLGKTKNK